MYTGVDGGYFGTFAPYSFDAVAVATMLPRPP
jgi:hypothetical protein